MLDKLIHDNENNPKTVVLLHKFLERLDKYRKSGLADRNFEQAINGKDKFQFLQRIFEVNLYHYLIGQGFKPTSKSKGPDFRIEHKGKVIWIEATSPKPIGVPNTFLEPPKHGEVRCGHLPEKEILLRITGKISDKKTIVDGYISEGIVHNEDAVILAVDCAQLGVCSDLSPNGFPPFVNAVYPVGHFAVTMDLNSGDVVRKDYQERRTILNKNNSPIDTDVFMKSDYKIISAVLGGRSGIQGFDEISLVHNYMAVEKIPAGLFACDKEYLPREIAAGIELRTR